MDLEGAAVGYAVYVGGTVALDDEWVMPRGGQILGFHELKPERASFGCHLALA